METSGKIEGARQDSNHVIRAMFIYVKGDVYFHESRAPFPSV